MQSLNFYVINLPEALTLLLDFGALLQIPRSGITKT